MSKRKFLATAERQHAEWDNIYDDVRAVGGILQSLKEVAFDIFREHKFIVEGSDEVREALVSFIGEVAGKYNDVLYHNFGHAVHVLRSAQYLLKNTVCEAYTDLEALALLFAALVHDVDHLGVPNSSLVAEAHEYALLYNDQNVAEMRSLTLAFELLREEKNNFLKFLKEDDFRTFRHLVVSFILATDINDHDKRQLLKLNLEDVLSRGDENVDFSIPKSRQIYLTVVLKLADIGASIQGSETAITWTEKYFRESSVISTDASTDEVRSASMTFIEGQISHCASLVEPLVTSAFRFAALPADLVYCFRQNLETNTNFWRSEKGASTVFQWGKS